MFWMVSTKTDGSRSDGGVPYSTRSIAKRRSPDDLQIIIQESLLWVIDAVSISLLQE